MRNIWHNIFMSEQLNNIIEDTSQGSISWLSNLVGSSNMKLNMMLTDTVFHRSKGEKGDHKVAVLGQCILNVMEDDLEEAFSNQGMDDVDVINWSAPGTTVAHSLKSIDKIKAAIHEHSIDSVLVFKGGNDLLQGRPIEEIKADLDTFITAMKETGLPVALIGVKHEDLRNVAEIKGYNESYISAAEEMYSSLAEKHNIPLYPSFFSGLSPKDYLDLKQDYTELLDFHGESYQLLSEDGQWELINALHDYATGMENLHPNPEGQQKIADPLAKFLIDEQIVKAESSEDFSTADLGDMPQNALPSGLPKSSPQKE